MGSNMFFLLRTAFWLTLVLVLIPLGSEEGTTEPQNAAVDPVSAFLAAQATVSDIGGFCARNADACETGGNALTAIGSRARDGARIVYEFLDTQIASQPAGDDLVTGSTSKISSRDMAAAVAGQSLPAAGETAAPLEVATGPVPRPKPRSGGNS